MSRPEDFPRPFLPNADRVVFDDDIFHPLDHWIGSRSCLSLQRNPLRAVLLHWRYEWSFGPWRARTAWWHRLTGCGIGRHRFETWWRYDADRQPIFGGRDCEWCRQDDPDLITHERIE